MKSISRTAKLLTTRRLAKKKKIDNYISCRVEALEKRELLTASSFSNGVGTDIEYSGPYGGYMPVGSGPSTYNGFSSFGLVDVPASGFALDAGASHINSLSLQLYNTTTSGKYAPTAGTFSVYLIPDNTTPPGNMRFGGPGASSGGTQTDLDAIGTISGGASTLGVDASDLLGTFSVTSALPLGYSTFTLNSIGSGAQAGIINDINNGQHVRLAVVAHDNSAKVDWDGSFSGHTPQVQVDVDEAPLVGFTAASYTVNETDQISGNHTIATISVHRSGNPFTSLDVNYHTSDGTAHQPADYASASGTLHWDAGDTSDKTFTVTFNDITTLNPNRTVNLSLTDHGGNPITPVFSTAGSSATLQINYLQAGSVYIDQSSYSVNEADGTVDIKVDRTGTNVASTTADVTLTLANGVPYQSDPQNPQDAQAGRDFGTLGDSTLPVYDIPFAAGQTSAIVHIPLIDVKTFAGTRSFSASLSNPSTGTQIITPSATTVAITDNAVGNSVTPNGITTQTSGVETNGPYYVNSFMVLASAPTGSISYASMPVLTFGAGSSVFSGDTASTIDSVKLSIYNTATTGGYAGTPGNFDVYLLTDDGTPDSALRYGGGTGNTGPTVIGSQASPIYIGSAAFTNNQVGYNDFVFDNLPAGAKTAITNAFNSGGTSLIRFAITPSQGSAVAADWEGNYFYNQPQLSLVVEKSGGAPAPQVTDVLVDGTSWSPDYLALLQSTNNGDGGYSIPVGSNSQLKDLPWANLNQIQVVFNQDVNVSQSSLSLTGTNVASYTINGFSYNPATFTATWTLAAPIGNDRLNINLQAGSITSVSGGTQLDGEWANGVSTYASGDGTAGGDFNFGFSVLPADANQDGVVNGIDIAQVASHWLQSGQVWDVNGDNVVNGLDIASIASHWLTVSPSGGGGMSADAPALETASVDAAAPLTTVATPVGTVTTPVESSTVAETQFAIESATVLPMVPQFSFVKSTSVDRTAASLGNASTVSPAAVDHVLSEVYEAPHGFDSFAEPSPFLGSTSSDDAIGPSSSASIDHVLVSSIASAKHHGRFI